MKRFIHDPDSVLDYFVEWASPDGTNDGTDSDTGWLQGDTISASTWAVDAGLTVEDSTQKTDTRGILWVSSATVGQRYSATNHIVTTGGREEDHTIEIICKEK